MRWRLADPKHESLTPAANWLIGKEIRRKGDWSVKRPNTEPSGWAFEYSNEFYPDIDDTAMVMLALSEVARRQSRGAAGGCQARAGLAARHAVERWRLGGFRRR